MTSPVPPRTLVAMLTVILPIVGCRTHQELPPAPVPPATQAFAAPVAVVDVQCFALEVHSEPYTAWQLYLVRSVKSEKGPVTTFTPLTSVGKDPANLTVRYKLLDDGTVYMSFVELDCAYSVAMGAERHVFVRSDKYKAVNAKERDLRVINKYSTETNERQFPLLQPRP